MFYVSKGNIIKWCIIVLCVVIAVLWLNDHKIMPWRVEKVAAAGSTMSEEDTGEFIRLFNLAWYKGTELDYGTTPDKGFTVYFKDGSVLCIEDYCGNNFIVRREQDGRAMKKHYYFIASEGLREFLTKLQNKAD